MDRLEDIRTSIKQKRWNKKAFEVTTSNAFLFHHPFSGLGNTQFRG